MSIALKAYNPRPSSLPPSPGLARAYSPRKEITDEVRQSAGLILELLSALPAPLPATLPPTYLPTPLPKSATPSPTRSFASFARKRPAPDSPIGLGLGLGSPSKRARASPPDSSSSLPAAGPSARRNGHARAASASAPRSPEARLTPDLGRTKSSTSPSLHAKRELGRSSLRHEVKDEARDGKAAWSRERWAECGNSIRERALLLKRHGDAHQRAPNAKPHLVAALAADSLRGLVCLTDAVMLYTFGRWCDEQARGRSSAGSYRDILALAEFVRKKWESEVRRVECDARERARGMVGLMFLVEAILSYNQSTENLHTLYRRSKDHSTASSASNPSPSPTNPSPSSSPSDSLPADMYPQLQSTSALSHHAATTLLTSRHHLSLRLLRSAFPQTWEHAIGSELADEVLPAPGDSLGAAAKLDIDNVAVFGWPVELGMHNAAAHVSVFGRGLVQELARGAGQEWDAAHEGAA
ncbi:hypothetical protein Q5752_000216 [Cryptotrichosporon argae]